MALDFMPVTYDPVDTEGRHTGAKFYLHLPERTVHQKLAEAVQHRDEQAQVMTLDQAVGAAQAGTLGGRVVIAARDERDVGMGPLMIYDHRPGMPPLLFISSATMPWQDTMDWMDEARHYGTPADEAQLADKPDMTTDYHQWIERATDAQVGRKRFGFAKAKTWM